MRISNVFFFFYLSGTHLYIKIYNLLFRQFSIMKVNLTDLADKKAGGIVKFGLQIYVFVSVVC